MEHGTKKKIVFGENQMKHFCKKDKLCVKWEIVTEIMCNGSRRLNK